MNSIHRSIAILLLLPAAVVAVDGNGRLKGMNNNSLRSSIKHKFKRMLAKGGGGNGGGGGGGGDNPPLADTCIVPNLGNGWWGISCDPIDGCDCNIDQTDSSTMGAGLVTKWMSIEPGECVELAPYDNSDAQSNICGVSGSGNDIGFLLKGWVEEGSTSYQHECKEGADSYDPVTDAPIAVSYIANKHKISIEVFDTAGNAIDVPADGCDTGRGFWWTDDIDNVNNPLYVEGGFVVKVKNNGNSRKNVRLYTRCNFQVCN